MNISITAPARIARLESRLINQIAAGEVVTRPAAALKEIIENALDAGASRLEISVADDALGFSVRDDGAGMDEENLRLCVERYATSKIRELADLLSLQTRGFRGEALAAIAAVSRLEIVTRGHDAPNGLKLKTSGGSNPRIAAAAANPGTTVTVRDLFFNTPARLKFLKNPVAEWGHMLQAIVRQALARPDVGFAIRWRGRPYLDLPARQGVADRLALILPGAQADLLHVDHTLHEVRVHGAISGPKTTRRDRRHQYFFANGRPIYWRPLGFAFEEAYRGLIMTQHYPMGGLLIELPGEMVDVNVHPTKDEVRFQQEALVSGAVHRAVGEALRGANLIPLLRVGSNPSKEASLKLADRKLDPGSSGPAQRPPQGQIESGSGAPEMRQIAMNALAALPANTVTGNMPQQPDFTPAFAFNAPPRTEPLYAVSPSNGQTQVRSETEAPGVQPAGFEAASGEARKEARLLLELGAAPSAPKILTQIALTYIVAEAPAGFGASDQGGVLVVDQHAAHEKILYMQFMGQAADARQSIPVQPLLIPHQLELSAMEAAALEPVLPMLAQTGFEIEPFGDRTYLVQALPALLERLDIPAFLRDLVDDLGQGDLLCELRRLRERICARAACRAAVKSGDRLTIPEMQRLVEQLLQTAEALRCPHGRPTAMLLTRDHLDRQFGRLG